MKLIGKVKYIGPSEFLWLTDGKVYDCYEVFELTLLRIVDDELIGDPYFDTYSEDYLPGYLYSATAPRSGRNVKTGRWEVVEDKSGLIQQAITGNKTADN